MDAPDAPAEIADYDPGWPGTFTELRGKVGGGYSPLAPRIERVGSTAVPGLRPAKSATDSYPRNHTEAGRL